MTLPPEAEQVSLVSYLSSVTTQLDALVVEAQRAINLLKERRSALISAAVTGKIDVQGLVENARPEIELESCINLHKEVEFENDICGHLATHGWFYDAADASAYDCKRALFTANVLAWVQETQTEAWEALTKSHGAAAETVLLDRIRKQPFTSLAFKLRQEPGGDAGPFWRGRECRRCMTRDRRGAFGRFRRRTGWRRRRRYLPRFAFRS